MTAMTFGEMKKKLFRKKDICFEILSESCFKENNNFTARNMWKKILQTNNYSKS